MSFLLGISCFTGEFICEQQNTGIKVILALFYPFTMFVGVYRALKHIMCEVISGCLENQCFEFRANF